MSESIAVQASLELPPPDSQSCAICGARGPVWPLGDGHICTDHLAFAVSLAANDVFAGDVTYNENFERFLIWG